MTNQEQIDSDYENGRDKLPEESMLLPDSPGHPDTEVELGKTNGKVPEVEAVPPRVRRLSEIAEELRGSKDTSCGLWIIKGKLLQRFANKKAYVILYGILGCIMSSSYAYLNGTLTTLEKRFKIPSTNTGIIMTGGDMSQLVLCLVLNYYGGRGHRPRWIAFGVYTVVAFCLMNALPHFLYGPGRDALALTEEFGSQHDNNTALLIEDTENRKAICQAETGSCDDTAGNLAPQVILFVAQVISGVGGSLYYTLGVSYMDDNIKKSKTPALVSLSYFLRMLGPAAGYAAASACLSFYISPTLTPTIGTKDPRWLGAWWMGWLVIGVALFLMASLVAMFPRSLPRAAARRVQASERRKAGLKADDEEDQAPTSFQDMKKTFIRLLFNKTLMCNNFASVFYFMGYMPYWVFMPKYIETIYKQSASASSFITGTVGLVFSAIGILASGVFISKFRPSARFLAAWNVVVGAVSVMGVISYAFLGCPVNDVQGTLLADGLMETTIPCNMDCHCDYVKYSPVCTPDGRTFISPCHAGCTEYKIVNNNTKVYTNCTCAPSPRRIKALMPPLSNSSDNLHTNHFDNVTNISVNLTNISDNVTNISDNVTNISNNLTNISAKLSLDKVPEDDPWVVKEGPCPVDCTSRFYLFLGIVCLLKFSGATGRTSNFLVSVRCVDDKDKTVSMGLGLMLMSLLAFVPSPILFGYLIDRTCMVWGKTCSGTGNCWLYNADMLRYLMNFTSAFFITIGTLFDFGVWYYVKGLKIFDEEVEMDVSPQRAKTQRK